MSSLNILIITDIAYLPFLIIKVVKINWLLCKVNGDFSIDFIFLVDILGTGDTYFSGVVPF